MYRMFNTHILYKQPHTCDRCAVKIRVKGSDLVKNKLQWKNLGLYLLLHYSVTLLTSQSCKDGSFYVISFHYSVHDVKFWKLKQRVTILIYQAFWKRVKLFVPQDITLLKCQSRLHFHGLNASLFLIKKSFNIWLQKTWKKVCLWWSYTVFCPFWGLVHFHCQCMNMSINYSKHLKMNTDLEYHMGE